MDPFTGLGSTAVACARLGVNFVGSEIDETYLKEAIERTRTAKATRVAKVANLKSKVASQSQVASRVGPRR
jgi:site-specific DNA-methyltransferase (adenine-specific)